MEFLGQFHPQIVHAPIALIIVGAAFELIGRAVGLDWWRKAAFAMLVVGVLGAWGGVISGKQAEEAAEKQTVPHEAIEAHEKPAQVTAWLGTAAVVARAVAGGAGGLKPLLGGLALVLHLLAAVGVGIAGYRGGELVFDHGAGVRAEARTPGVEPSGPHH
jgi:uncharacterized membrane protein